MQKYIKEALLIILAVSLVFLSIGIFVKKEAQRVKKEAAVATLDALRSSLSRLGDECKDKEKLKDQQQKKLDELSQESAALEIQISQIQKICEEAEGQLADITNELSNSHGSRKNLTAEKEELTNKISSAESEVKELEKQLVALEQAAYALTRHYQKMVRTSAIKTENPPEQQATKEPEAPTAAVAPETVQETASLPAPSPELPEVPVAKEETPEEELARNTAPSSLEGEILVVNREFNFVVVNLGKQNGIKPGDRLRIYDGDKMLGEVNVETVRRTICAATGGKNLDAYRLRAGNKVRL